MRDIFIFGGGAWGIALAFAFYENNNVFVLSRRKLLLDTYRPPLDSHSHITMQHHSNKKHNNTQSYDTNIHHHRFPSTSHTIMQIDYKDFVNIHQHSHDPLCVIAIASAFLRNFMNQATFLESCKKDMKILVASKGIEQGSGAFVNEILEQHFDKNNLCYLAGPSFAKEVLAKKPCALVIHSPNQALSQKYADCFPNFIKTYIQNDIIGAEIAGAYKNVIAIAGGISDGLELGNNAKASLLSRGLVEMARFGDYFGAKQETFLGLSGSGDLFLTSNSIMSRNYRVGFALAEGKKLTDILKELGEVAEGVYSAKSITELGKKHNLYTPIASEVQAILDGGAVYDGLRNLLAKKS